MPWLRPASGTITNSGVNVTRRNCAHNCTALTSWISSSKISRSKRSSLPTSAMAAISAGANSTEWPRRLNIARIVSSAPPDIDPITSAWL